MKSSKIDRIISVVVIGTCLIKAVLYGGSKPPSTTNEPPSDISGDLPTNNVDAASSPRQEDDIPTNPPPMMCFSPRPMMSPPPEQTENELSATYHSSLIPQTSWNTRGAYCDWLRVDFPDSFEFPYGTNMLNGLTLMAYGELRENLHCSPSAFTLNLPQQVSIEPDVSSVSYGLTPSNSFVFTWSNVCVNRSPTNRVDASIELFDSGAIATTVTPLSTPTPPTCTYIPPTPPEGFVGEGQDDDWLANAFPSHYAAITNGGYDAWLSDYIGHNEPNGRYKVDVTVAALPNHGPCYLVIGPYKMVVTAPGTYSFPLEVFNEYSAYTCPTRVPLSFSYDDGYDCGEVLDSSPLMMSAPPLMSPPPTPDYYIVCMVPNVYIVPSHVPLSQAVGTHLGIYCNYPSGSWDYFSFSSSFRMAFSSRSDAEIEAAEMVDRVVVMMSVAGHECSGVFYIDPPPNDDDPPHHKCCNACCGDACRCDGTCCLCNCDCHSSSNSDTNTPPDSATP